MDNVTEIVFNCQAIEYNQLLGDIELTNCFGWMLSESVFLYGAASTVTQ